MKYFFYCSLLLSLFACKRRKIIVDPVFIDSVLSHYMPSPGARTNALDLAFWKSRVDTMPESFVNLQKYAQALATRFHIYGDVDDLKSADSIMHKISYQYKEPGFLLSLAGYSMLQHRFTEAGRYIDAVIQMEAEPYAAQMMLFDVNFELAKYYEAATILRNTARPRDYDYNFRLSKQDHYRGELDSAIAHMLEAADLAYANPYLRQAALSNAADLYIHDGNLMKAALLYTRCVQANSCDFHSLMGLGWIALLHDGNDSLAIKIFSFVRQKIKSPEPLLKLSQATELKDRRLAKTYAAEFAKIAEQPAFGNMYNKYLVQVYTGILDQPAKALEISQREIQHRATPQTYAWLAWSLFVNNKKEAAWKMYQEHVSGKPLEGPELFMVGKLMKGLGKGYNAQEFFKSAEKNKYDLSPAMMKELEDGL